ncbi:putative photosynthetic complex assembly protein PuhE [Sphingomonas sp. BIUV-7]|uniref:Photosynthetic complex assembly protein PuhE n=1 Tax=Sphingomonas natans TaxID=3063330 RepID=A0ABT8YEX4_9SPHN|nr:putative photosynthetic complex assembly protein PuhE [Sphingomonas sp. BIUV-7]MDO6416219.1 putative photosynthetic complex assembly protein PuhE [Sphingomonas sp. BIUV-7]
MTVPPLLFALLMWFIGTGTIVWLDSRPRETFATSLKLAGIAAIAAIVLVWIKADDVSAGGAYVGFAAAIVIWGWHEMSFLMGVVAGPNRAICPPGATGWRRFAAATATVIHHELAIAATAILLAAVTWGAANQAAPLAFLLLFVLRLSAKFNLYLGVPNLSDEVFPPHLAYLKSYFRKAPLNPLFPVSILLGSAIAAWAWIAAEWAPPGSGASACATLLAGLAALGVVEHLFLVLPLRDARMWRWASSTSHQAAKAAINGTRSGKIA